MADYDFQQSTAPVQPSLDEQAQKTKRSESIKSIVSTIAVLLIAPLVALCMTAFVFQSYQVDGESMQTTLFNNDRLIVWKAAKTWSHITGHPYIPARGDIIIFQEYGLSQYGEPENSKQLIKRVIGLPGDRVVVHNGSVTVYNKQHPDGFQPDKTMPYGYVIPVTMGDINQVIPANEVYAMGDNRGNSLDSRIFGPVNVKDIVGKLVLRVWPLNSVKRF